MEKGDLHQHLEWAANPNAGQSIQHFVTAGIVTLLLNVLAGPSNPQNQHYTTLRPVSFKAGNNSQDTPSLPQCCRERFVRHFRS